MAERNIILRDMELTNGMTGLRLHFVETVAKKDGKESRKRFSRDFVLDDYKVKGKLPEKKDKDGNLIHQNPIFLSGHFRGPVVAKIVGELCNEFYPGRNPRACIAPFHSFAIASGKVLNNKEKDLQENLKAVKAAMKVLLERFASEDYSETSLAFYRSTQGMLAGFGRSEGDNDSEDDE